VRVAVQLAAGFILRVALVQSVVNVSLPVADAAASINAASAGLDYGGSLRRAGEEEEGSGNLLYSSVRRWQINVPWKTHLADLHCY
jgi:hypothetical protein